MYGMNGAWQDNFSELRAKLIKPPLVLAFSLLNLSRFFAHTSRQSFTKSAIGFAPAADRTLPSVRHLLDHEIHLSGSICPEC